MGNWTTKDRWDGKVMGNFWRFETNPFWNHEWREFDAGVFVRTIGRLIAINIAVQIGLASLFLLVKPSPFWVGSNLLIATLIFHLIARTQVDRQVPKRSFVDDAQRGTLDFLRILPVSGHELVIARKLPAWFLRVFIAGLWSPLYAASFALLGLPPTSSIPFSLLLGTSSWMWAFGLILLFLLPAPAIVSLLLLFSLVVFWSSESINRIDKTSEERRLFFAAGWAVLLALGLIALNFSKVAAWQGAFDFFSPQPFYSKFLVPAWASLWLMAATGWVRVDRVSRWLETPKGMRRFYFVPSLFTVLFFAQGYLWGWLQQVQRWKPEDCFAACASFTFAFGGILHWLWLNWSWAEKTPPEKPPVAWLPETTAWRLVTVFVPLFGCWQASLPLSQIDWVFFSLWLFVSAIDIFSLALTKSLSFWTIVDWRLKGFEFLSSFAFVPVLGFVLRLPFFIAFSPSVALLLLGWRPLFASFNPIRVGGLFSIAVPTISLLTAAIAPTIRMISLAIAWRLLSSAELNLRFRLETNFFVRLIGFVNLVGEFVFVLPAIEKMLIARSQNPVFRHMVSVTRWRYNWLPYLAAFTVGFAEPPLSAALLVAIALVFVPVFWFATYTTVHNYLRKLHQTGELWQWLITPLPSKTIVNGWRYGGWWWQLRWLGLIMWLFAGGLISVGISNLFKLWLFLTPVLVIIAGMGTLVIAIMVMGAVPTAIVDALREPQQAFSRQGQQWSRRKAFGLAGLMTMVVGISFGSCGFLWFVAPFVGLLMSTVGIDPAFRALEQIRKAPMDKLPP
ncbi:MAG: hypothetical protein RMK94_08235 [Armatimonadota bacterium]|nr:hypothetical protein [Armatimonadota bacterium]